MQESGEKTHSGEEPQPSDEEAGLFKAFGGANSQQTRSLLSCRLSGWRLVDTSMLFVFAGEEYGLQRGSTSHSSDKAGGVFFGLYLLLFSFFIFCFVCFSFFNFLAFRPFEGCPAQRIDAVPLHRVLSRLGQQTSLVRSGQTAWWSATDTPKSVERRCAGETRKHSKADISADSPLPYFVFPQRMPCCCSSKTETLRNV